MSAPGPRGSSPGAAVSATSPEQNQDKSFGSTPTNLDMQPSAAAETPEPSSTVPATTLQSASASPQRPLYIPQFTAATEMLLKRMRGEASSLSAALSSTAGIRPAGTIQASTYEEVRRRLISGMSTSSSLTMSLPDQPPREPAVTVPPGKKENRAATKAPSAAKQSIIRKISAGAIGKGSGSGKQGQSKANTADGKKQKGLAGHSTKAGVKRKRGKAQGDEESSSELSSLSDFDSEGAKPTAAPLTTTKSGRQVTRPNTYNPNAADLATKKRVHYGKRRPEEVLCRWCTRWAETDQNQMVFCDGCNDGWHQLCHEPWIDDLVVSDPNKSWYCRHCQKKKDKEPGKKKPQPVAPHRGSWAGKTDGQKRAYLSGLSQIDLVNLLVHCADLHPDLPIFPLDDKPSSGALRSLFAGSTTEGLFTRAETNPSGPANPAKKVSKNGRTDTSSPKVKAANGATAAASQKNGTHGITQPAPLSHSNSIEQAGDGGGANDDEEDDDPFVKGWPKPGRGMYSRLPPEPEDPFLVDSNDYEAFSHIVYDLKGRKVEENGMRITYDVKGRVVAENGRRA